MAVAVDAKTSGGSGTSGLCDQFTGVATTGNLAHITVGAAATLLVVALTLGKGSTPSPSGATCTWNSVSMNLAVNVTANDGADFMTLCIFTLVNPASGANNLNASWTGSSDGYISAISLTGTDTTTGYNSADNQSTATGFTVTIPSATNDATFADNVSNGTAGVSTQTTLFTDSAEPVPGGAASYALGGTSNIHTFTGAGSTVKCTAGIHIIAGGAADPLLAQICI